jgi:hypothetical protein
MTELDRKTLDLVIGEVDVSELLDCLAGDPASISDRLLEYLKAKLGADFQSTPGLVAQAHYWYEGSCLRFVVQRPESDLEYASRLGKIKDRAVRRLVSRNDPVQQRISEIDSLLAILANNSNT